MRFRNPVFKGRQMAPAAHQKIRRLDQAQMGRRQVIR